FRTTAYRSERVSGRRSASFWRLVLCALTGCRSPSQARVVRPRDLGIAGDAVVDEQSQGAVMPRPKWAVTCVGSSVKALFTGRSGPRVLVKVERPQRSEDERP